MPKNTESTIPIAASERDLGPLEMTPTTIAASNADTSAPAMIGSVETEPASKNATQIPGNVE